MDRTVSEWATAPGRFRRGHEVFAEGLLLCARAAAELGDPNAAVQLLDELLRRYGEDPDPDLCEIVAMAMTGRGWTLGEMGQLDQAIAVYDEMLARFHDATARDIPRWVAAALNGRAYWLEASGRDQDALADYRAVIERFADHENPDIAEQVRHARTKNDDLSEPKPGRH